MDQFADIAFPSRGLDLSPPVTGQTPGTTPVGVNVRLFEPASLRARGGTRPGLSKFIPDRLPSGAHEVQHLAVVLFSSDLGLPGNFPPPDLDPVTGLPPVDDTSDDGNPDTWGHGTPIDGTTGLPATDPDLGTPLPPFDSRNPHGTLAGGGHQAPRKHRDEGSGESFGKNVLMYRPEARGPHAIFNATYSFRVAGGPFDGTIQLLASDNECHAYNPPLIPAPTTFFQFPTGTARYAARLALIAPGVDAAVISDVVNGGTVPC